MITEKMKQIMQQIKELEPDYEFLTEKKLKKGLKNVKKKIQILK